jgi:hypothetical protein
MCCAPSTRLQGRARRPAAPKPREEGWFNLRNAAGMLFKLPGRAKSERSSRPSQARTGRRRADPRRARRPCRSNSRRKAPCRATASSASCSRGQGITIYPIQSPSLTAFDDQPDRWIDVRWDIDEGRRSVSRRRIGHRDQCARFAGRDRAGHRRQRRQHPHAVDGPHGAGLHRNDCSTLKSGT